MQLASLHNFRRQKCSRHQLIRFFRLVQSLKMCVIAVNLNNFIITYQQFYPVFLLFFDSILYDKKTVDKHNCVRYNLGKLNRQ